VSDQLFATGDGHTGLSEEDRLGLIPTHVATRGQLFAAEQSNIAIALLRRQPKIEELLDDRYLRTLHRAMFAEVWEWAGRYRLSQTNIGIACEQIPTAVRDLVDDTRAWVEHSTYENDEIAVRFHHGMVAIHAFPNGNGRHGRVAADYLISALGAEAFTWGAHRSETTNDVRDTYRRALQRADRGDIAGLMAFARS
jgi:Fic-DOC domain mobile mystery protein B